MRHFNEKRRQTNARLPLVNPLPRPLVFLIKNSFPPRSYFSPLPLPPPVPFSSTRHNINPGTRTKRLIDQFTPVHPDMVALITFNYVRRINSHSHQRGRPRASKRSEFSLSNYFHAQRAKRIDKFSVQFDCLSLSLSLCNF